MAGSGAEELKKRVGVKRDGQREEMLPLLKRHEVQVLRRAGMSVAKVSSLAGVSRRSIQRIEAEEAVAAEVDDARERTRRGIGRPSKLDPYRPLIAQLLQEEPDLMSLEILRRAKLAGYTGSKSVLYDLVASMRPPKQRPVV